MSTMKIYTPLFMLKLSLFTGSVLLAQAPEMEWATGYGTDYGNHVHHGMQTLDGGYIAVGTSRDETGCSNMLIVKTDSRGQLVWQKMIGEKNQNDMANSVCQDKIGDFYIAGALVSRGEQESAIIKVSQSGKLIWQKIYPHVGADVIEGISLTRDGGLVATGYCNSNQYGSRFIVMDGEGLLMKIDADGKLLWEKTLVSLPQGMMAYEVDEGYAIAGTVWKYKEGKQDHQDVCLVITDHEGNEQWSRTYGDTTEWDQCYDFAVTSDGGYIFAGHTRSYGVANWDFFLLKIDKNRNEQWHRTFGQPRGYNPDYIHDESYGVKETPDGGFVMVGGTGDEYPYSESGHPKGSSDLWLAYLVKTDVHGNLEWEGIYGSPSGHNAGEYLDVTRDGGFIIFSDSDTYGDLKRNSFGFIKIKTDKKGEK